MPMREWPLPVFGIALCDARERKQVTKTVKNLSHSVTVQRKVDSPMKVSDSPMGGDTDQVAKNWVGNRALIAAEGRLRR